MNGQFEQESFNHLKLSRFADLLTQHEFEVSVQWKNGMKKVDAPDENTNFFELKHKNKILFRQNRTTGVINMGQLNALEKKIFLRELKTYNFYTKPTWALGIGLLLLYVGLMLLVAFTRDESVLSAILLVSLVFTLVLLAATYFWSTGKISEKSYPYFYLFGIGYLFTAPSSMLALPIFKQCLRSRLYREVTDGAVDIGTASA